MRRLRKILIWFLAIALVFIMGIFIAASVYIKSFKPELERALTENLGMETKIDGPISLKMMPGVSFVASDIKIINKETYLVRMEKIEIAINYLGVFGGPTKIRELHFFKPQVYIVREADGSFNFQSDYKDLNIANPNDVKSYGIDLRELTVQDGIILYFDRQTGDTLKASGINLNSDHIGLTGIARKIEAQQLSFEGMLAITHFKINLLKADSLNFKVAGRGGKISIQPVDSDYFGGKSSGKAIIDFTPVSPLIQIQHQMIGLDIANYQEATHTGNFLTGKMNYSLDVTFNSFDWQKVAESITGSVIIDAENIVFEGLHIEKILKQYNDSQVFNVKDLGVLFFAGPFRSVFIKNFDPAHLHSDFGTTNIRHIVSRWNVNKGVANAQDVAFNTEKYRFAVNGSIDFRNDSFNNLTISLVNKKGCSVLSERLNGPCENPETTTASVIMEIPQPVGNYWKELAMPKEEFCTVAYKGSVEAPGL